jgi:hypothetical protein
MTDQEVTMRRTAPGPLRYISYSFGRKLPESMQDWVRNDLTGEAAIPRHLFRSMVPLLPIFTAALFLPGPPVVRTSTILLAVLLALIYSFAFMDMNRRRRLSQHGLPEDLESVRKARRRQRSREEYERLYPHAPA